MKTKSRQEPRRFQLKLLGYGNSYYIERVARLESALRRRPRRLQIDLIGEGEITADTALLICSILRKRPAKTHLTTNAQSSLKGASVLVWLAGDTRLIRDDARVFLPRSEIFANGEADSRMGWKSDSSKYADADAEIDLEDDDYARALHVINEFLPVKELVGRPIDVPTLRRFGLVENEQLDRFLANAFGRPPAAEEDPPSGPKEKRVRSRTSPVDK